jgi:putative hydrolase of the HAD superfamily
MNFIPYFLSFSHVFSMDQMNMKNIKAVVVDVDGVLVKSLDENGKFLWSRRIEKDLGITSFYFKRIFNHDWLDVTKGKIETKLHLSLSFQELGLTLSVEDYLSYWLENDSNINLEILNICEKIQKNMQVPIYIGTNQDFYRTTHLWKNLKFSEKFNGIFTSSKIGYVKPEKEFYKHIQEKLTLDGKSILLIDDTKSNIDAAQNYGWLTHHYSQINELKAFLYN